MFCVYIVVKMGVKIGVMRWVLLAIGAILVADSCFVAMVCNMNLGVVLPAVLGLPLLLLGLFWAPAQALFLTPFGRVIKWVLIGGYALFAASFAVVCGLIAGRIALGDTVTLKVRDGRIAVEKQGAVENVNA